MKCSVESTRQIKGGEILMEITIIAEDKYGDELYNNVLFRFGLVWFGSDELTPWHSIIMFENRSNIGSIHIVILHSACRLLISIAKMI